MNMFLTDDEILEIVRVGAVSPFDAVSKAQVKKMVRWAEQPCKEHYEGMQSGHIQRRFCEYCWQALLKELGL